VLRGNNKQIGRETRVGRQSNFAGSQSHLAQPVACDIIVDSPRKREHDSLVASCWRGRHQKLSIHKLVPRTELGSLVDELIELLDHPPMLTESWHWHSMLGWKTRAQLCTRHHC
jgi:hypothetical protein